MFVIDAVKGKMLILGRVGENQARAVRFNTACIQAEFPGATVSILNRRPNDEEAYPVNGQFIIEESGNLLWVLQSGDLAEDGLGECEMKASLNGQIVKDDIYDTKVLRALDESAEPPEPWESWVEQVEGAAKDSEAWAVGERGGEPVEEGDETYHNNAKYYAEEVSGALASKADKRDTVLETTLSCGRKSGTTVGNNSFAFGAVVTASSSYAHAEGSNTTASAVMAHAEGYKTTASASYTHAEGNETTASGAAAHAEGYKTTASGQSAHAEGYNATASGSYSHAEGTGTIAKNKSQHVFGEFNVEDPYSTSASSRGRFVEIVGTGTAVGARHNARTLDWNGNERLKGDLYVGANSDGTGGTKVAKVTDIPDPVDVSGKADKVESAVSGNFAALDAEGNLADSGHKHSDYLTAHQDISGKADKVSGAVSGNLAALDENGNLVDSGKAASGMLPTVSSTDNGKVLRVVDGAWAAALLPSASGVSF